MSYQQPPPGPSQPSSYPGQPGPSGPTPPVGQPQRKQRRPGTRLLTAGLIMLGVSVIGGIIAVVISAVSIFNSFEEFENTTYPINEHASVDGLGDNRWYIYHEPGTAGSTTCEVTDAQGNDVTDNSSDMEISNNDFDYEAFQSFETTADGVYEIECTDYPVTLGGAVPFGSIIAMIISVVAAVAIFVVGVVLTIIGIVLRSRSKNNQLPPTGPPYGAPPQPGYGYQQPQQPYGQQPPQYGGGYPGGYPPTIPPRP